MPAPATGANTPRSGRPGAPAPARRQCSPGIGQSLPAVARPVASQTAPSPGPRCAALAATAPRHAPPSARSPRIPSHWPAPAAPHRHCRGGAETAAAATPFGHREPRCARASRRANSHLTASTCAPSRASSPVPWLFAAGPSLLLRAAASPPRPKGSEQPSPEPSAPEMAPLLCLYRPAWLAPRGGPVFVSPLDQFSL